VAELACSLISRHHLRTCHGDEVKATVDGCFGPQTGLADVIEVDPLGDLVGAAAVLRGLEGESTFVVSTAGRRH